jgi:hypothetical protein
MESDSKWQYQRVFALLFSIAYLKQGLLVIHVVGVPYTKQTKGGGVRDTPYLSVCRVFELLNPSDYLVCMGDKLDLSCYLPSSCGSVRS